MGSLRFSDYCNSPTVLLPPQPIHTFSPASCSLPVQHQQAYSTSLLSNSQDSCQPNQAVSSAPATANPSRKRTRDESFDEPSETLLGNSWQAPSLHQVPMETTEEDNPTILSDNMEITRSITDDAIPIGNQSMACFGKQADTETAAATDAAVQQAVGQGEILAEPSRKVRRRDRSSSRESMTRNPSKGDGAPKSCPEDPPIDESTYLLGIGWTLIGEDSDVQAAARGCAKYIENHYPLSTAKIILQSKGLEAVLVETNHGYHLFKEDLSEGKLVSVSWQTCLANLQRSPIVFEGLMTLKSARKNRGSLSKSSCEDGSSLDANLSISSADVQMSMG
ncbi:hypothetical protein MMC07_003257 [Pseudocyphellaria aurata]|nr:hypothetical protein [Pseudocyphellaria aurata]